MYVKTEQNLYWNLHKFTVYIILAEGPGVARGKKWEENKEEKYRIFLA